MLKPSFASTNYLLSLFSCVFVYIDGCTVLECYQPRDDLPFLVDVPGDRTKCYAFLMRTEKDWNTFLSSLYVLSPTNKISSKQLWRSFKQNRAFTIQGFILLAPSSVIVKLYDYKKHLYWNISNSFVPIIFDVAKALDSVEIN